jgi:hypothetical protein
MCVLPFNAPRRRMLVRCIFAERADRGYIATRAVSGEQREDGVPNQGKRRRKRDQDHQCACAPPASTCM